MIGTVVGLATTSISMQIGAEVTSFGFDNCEHHLELLDQAIQHYSAHYENEVANLNLQFNRAFHDKMHDYYQLKGQIEELTTQVSLLNGQIDMKDRHIESMNQVISEKDIQIQSMLESLSLVGISTVGIGTT